MVFRIDHNSNFFQRDFFGSQLFTSETRMLFCDNKRKSNMSANEVFAKFIGSWKGTNKLFLSWLPDPLKESDSTLTVSLKANGQFVAFDYTWAYEGQPQEGLILLGFDTNSNAAQTVWTDSWHSRNTLMLSDGTVADDGSVSVQGYYKVTDNPDWVWRTEIVPKDHSLRIVMYNVSPENIEELAVETEFSRV